MSLTRTINGREFDFTPVAESLSHERIIYALKRGEVADVVLEPGDATRYELTIFHRPRGWGEGSLLIVKTNGVMGCGVTSVYGPHAWNFDESHLSAWTVTVIVEFIKTLQEYWSVT